MSPLVVSRRDGVQARWGDGGVPWVAAKPPVSGKGQSFPASLFLLLECPPRQRAEAVCAEEPLRPAPRPVRAWPQTPPAD